jgi:hypothetical protein
MMSLDARAKFARVPHAVVVAPARMVRLAAVVGTIVDVLVGVLAMVNRATS